MSIGDLAFVAAMRDVTKERQQRVSELLRECLPLLREAPNRYAGNVIERIEKALKMMEGNQQKP